MCVFLHAILAAKLYMTRGDQPLGLPVATGR